MTTTASNSSRTLGEILEAEQEYFDKVGPSDDWGWGFVSGKLSALRWVLGRERDFLDT